MDPVTSMLPPPPPPPPPPQGDVLVLPKVAGSGGQNDLLVVRATTTRTSHCTFAVRGAGYNHSGGRSSPSPARPAHAASLSGSPATSRRRGAIYTISDAFGIFGAVFRPFFGEAAVDRACNRRSARCILSVVLMVCAVAVARRSGRWRWRRATARCSPRGASTPSRAPRGASAESSPPPSWCAPGAAGGHDDTRRPLKVCAAGLRLSL
jgi:hypothetical protein